MDLIWMSWRVEDSSCDVKGVGDDYDVFDIMVSSHLVIPQQMAKSSALAVVILVALCKVLTIALLKEWICEMEVATWFLILASNTTMDEKGSEDALSMVSSKFSMCFLIFEEREWKEK